MACVTVNPTTVKPLNSIYNHPEGAGDICAPIKHPCDTDKKAKK